MKNGEKGKFDQIYLLIERYLCPVKPSEYRPSRRFDAGTKPTIQPIEKPIEKATTFKSNDRMNVLKDSERAYPWI